MFWHYYSAITLSGMEWRVKTSFKIIQVHQSRSNSVWLHQSPLTEASSSVSPMLYKWAGPFKWDYWRGTRERNMTKQGISEEWGEVREREKLFTLFHLVSGEVLVGLWPRPDLIMTHDCPEIYGPLQTQWHSAHYQYQQSNPLPTHTDQMYIHADN